MSVYNGDVSVRLEGDQARALALVPEGRLLLEKAQSFVTRADVPTYSMSRVVDGDSYIYVLIAGSVRSIHISSAVRTVDSVYDEFDTPVASLFPDFLSGAVVSGSQITLPVQQADGSTLPANFVRGFVPTPGCAKTHNLPTGESPNARLSVLPHESMSEWNNPFPNGALTFTQYVTPRNGAWSGTMKKVVQLVFGMGRINPQMLKSPKSKAKTKFMEDVAKNGMQVQYDYKFMRTHGVYIANDKSLWLVEISGAKGVVAMRLPIFPNSDTQGFRDRAETRGDQAMLFALDEFGCLPTGESFPGGQVFADKLASGDIIQLATTEEMKDFFSLSGYSSACGWSFNTKGSEAHNVGYKWPDEDVLQHGYWYQLSININPTANRRSGQPDATGTATLRLQSEGILYSPPVKNSFIPVKYHEPMLPGLLSHSAKPIAGTGPVACDTVVYVGVMNDELKVAKYFKPASAEISSDFSDDRIGEQCLLEGSWSWRSTYGNRSLPAMPYTNDLDNRDILEEHVTEGTLTSNSIGYTPPAFGDFIEAPEASYVFRAKMWKQIVVQETRGGESRGACFIVPEHSRDAYYYFEGHSYNGGRAGFTSTTHASVMDPYMYYGWRKWPKIAAPPYPAGIGCSITKCGGKHTERRIICESFTTFTCSDYADGGPWAGECQDIVSLCSANQPAYLNDFTSWDLGTDFEGSWHFRVDGSPSPFQGKIDENEYSYAMRPSPDPDTGNIQFLSASHNSLGDYQLSYQQGFGAMKHQGYSPSSLEKTIPLFIGVNQP